MFHTYYGVDSLKYINWFPSPSASQLAKNRGLVFKARQGSVDIYASCSFENDQYVLDYSLQEAFTLIFYISFADNYWSNITSEGLVESKNKWFFTNTSAINGQENSLPLHEQAYATQANQIEPVQKGTLYPLETTQQTVDVYKKENSVETLSFLIETVNEATYLNTRPMDEGWYIIKEENKIIKEIFITDIGVSYDAICHLSFDPMLDGNLVNKDWTWRPAHFQIKYESLKTYWEYVVLKEKLEFIEGLKVVDAKQTLIFDDPIESIHDGKDTLTFRSLDPIALSKAPKHVFQLQKNVGVAGKTASIIINRLPIPSKEVLYSIGENEKIYSTIYINF